MADLLSNGLERIGRQTDHRQVLDLQMPVVQPLQVTTPPEQLMQQRCRLPFSTQYRRGRIAAPCF